MALSIKYSKKTVMKSYIGVAKVIIQLGRDMVTLKYSKEMTTVKSLFNVKSKTNVNIAAKIP